jgi:hypothetical protein
MLISNHAICSNLCWDKHWFDTHYCTSSLTRILITLRWIAGPLGILFIWWHENESNNNRISHILYNMGSSTIHLCNNLNWFSQCKRGHLPQTIGVGVISLTISRTEIDGYKVPSTYTTNFVWVLYGYVTFWASWVNACRGAGLWLQLDRLSWSQSHHSAPTTSTAHTSTRRQQGSRSCGRREQWYSCSVASWAC